MVQISFAEKKIKAEESVTFQNIFSSMADFGDVVSVLPAARLIKASRIFVAEQKANRTWEIKDSFLAFWWSSVGASNVKEAAACELIGTKKGAIFSLIYFFKSFCIYSIPHNYVIPQAMLHGIPQTHSSFYPHRFFKVMRKRNTEFKSVFQS